MFVLDDDDDDDDDVFQVRYPDRIALIRGNHESRQITQVWFLYSISFQSILSTKIRLSPSFLSSRCTAFTTSVKGNMVQ